MALNPGRQVPKLQQGEYLDAPYLPWATGVISPKKMNVLKTSVKEEENEKENLIGVTIIREGDAETTYNLRIPSKILVKDLKKRIVEDTCGLIKPEAMSFRAVEAGDVLKDTDQLTCSEGAMLIMETDMKRVSETDLKKIKKAKDAGAKCCIQ